MRTACSDGGSSLPWSKARRKVLTSCVVETTPPAPLPQLALKRCTSRRVPVESG
ncbi:MULTISPECIES: hypothetical protein [unclassified Nonomuraea]|uniref:hypothetical protein n=1 Tax=unclassified Nonomuraea TaxID=2593643 RepID=UPI0035C0255F